MQKLPPRVERTEFEKHHVLLPDGYWDQPKCEGGVGAVLLRDGGNPYAFGGMVPHYLRHYLMCEQELPTAKKQRNTQAELFAILMALLMFHEDLKGNSLLVLTDSTAALHIAREGVAADQQNRDTVAHIHFFAHIHRVHLWFDCVPASRTLGIPTAGL